MEELPLLVELQKKWQEKGLQVRLVNMEHPDQAENTLKFLKTYGASALSTIKPPNTENFFQSLGFEPPAGLPLSGLWSPEKGLISQWAGTKTLDELELEVKAHLE